MGAFKPLLPFGRGTVIEACAENLLAAGVGELIVVVGYRANEVRAQMIHLPVRFAVNEDAEAEMSDSIARGVEAVSVEAGAVLIALADQPAIAPETIKELLGEWQRTGARLLVPETGGRGGHPVLIDLAYRAELLALDWQRGLRALFADHADETQRIALSSPYIARDMDTWDDYRTLHEDVFGVPPPPATMPRE